MRLDIPKHFLELYGKKDHGILSPGRVGYHDFSSVESSHLSAADIRGMSLLATKLTKSLRAHTADGKVLDMAKEVRRLNAQLAGLIALEDDAGKSVKRLDLAAEVLRRHISEDVPRAWLFDEDEGSGRLLPWLVDSVVYKPPERNRGGESPAQVVLTMKCWERGHVLEAHRYWFTADLSGGKTPGELLADKNLVEATAESVAEHDEEVIRYDGLRKQLGEQMLGQGRVSQLSEDEEDDDDDRRGWRWSRSQDLNLSADGTKTKMVIDDSVGWKKEPREIEHELNGKRDRNGELEDDAELPVVTLPVSPKIRAFSLFHHQYGIVPSANLEPYVYDETLASKLVIGPDELDLLDTLIGLALNPEAGTGSDFVRGKSGGMTVLCHGIPGTGKTLTAEVFAEKNKRPLYAVQCSQLGIDVKALEKNLTKVLANASRWNAVLLIDEADVYVRERGDDIVQNAIVGVFLRVLEYYSGILFMTTNRAESIDDAIVSRCIAKFGFAAPSRNEDRVKLWRIQLANYGVKVSGPTLTQLVATYGACTGRNVKQLCRLVRASCGNKEATTKDFAHAAKYAPITASTITPQESASARAQRLLSRHSEG